MSDWLAKITAWFLELFTAVFTALVTFIHDAALWLFDLLLIAVAGIVAAIPVPTFLSVGIDLTSLFATFPPFALYLLHLLNIPQCIGVLTAGIAFRLVRKLVTLGQW